MDEYAYEDGKAILKATELWIKCLNYATNAGLLIVRENGDESFYNIWPQGELEDMDADIYLSLQNYGDANCMVCMVCMTEINIEYDEDGNLEYEGGHDFPLKNFDHFKKELSRIYGQDMRLHALNQLLEDKE